MCTHNGALYLREQLESIAAQTRLPDELVVCDDASADATREIVVNFGASSPFPVSLHANHIALGSTKNFEKAIALSTGDLIALSDQDDVWRADKLAMIEKRFSENPEIGMVFSDAQIVDEQLGDTNRRLWVESGFDEKKRRAIRGGKAFDVLLPAWWVTGATMAFEAKFKELVLPIPSDLPMIHDGWISLMIAAVAEVGMIDEQLIMYRQHARQQLGAPTKRDGSVTSKAKLLAKVTAGPRNDSYSDLIRTLLAINERLELRGKKERKGTAPIEYRLKHLNARSNLPVHAFGRLPLVLRELITLRYHRFSNGVSSAVRDLLYAPTNSGSRRDAADEASPASKKSFVG